MKFAHKAAFTAIASVCLAALTAPVLAQEFVTIDPLPGDDWVRIRGVSADGAVATGSSYAGSWANGRAFIWTADTGAVALPSNGFNSWALDISDDGTTIVGGIQDGNSTAVRWVNGELELLAVTPEIPWIGVLAVSADGNTIVGEAEVDGEFVAIRWRPDGITAIDDFKSGAYTFATAVSGDGNVVTGLSEYEAAEGFRWTDDTGVEWLGFLPGGSWHSTATSVNYDGSIATGQSHVPGGNFAAAYWTVDDGWVEVPSIIASSSFANAIQSLTGDGSLMVGYNTGSSPSAWQTIIYDEDNGPRPLQQVLEDEYGFDFGDWDLSGFNPNGPNIANVGVSASGNAFYGSAANPVTGEEGSWIAFTASNIPGDLNGDGIVNGADLLILLSAWGECADPDDCPADLNGDGAVDGADLLILLANWG